MTRALADLVTMPLQLLAALRTILSSRRLFLLCLVPWLVGLVSFPLYGALLVSWRDEVAALFVTPGGWLSAALEWVAAILGVLLATILSLLTVLLLAGVFLEELVEVLLATRGLRPEEPETLSAIAGAFARAIRDDLIRLGCILGLTLLAILMSLIPPLLVLPAIIGFFLVGWDIVDLPLALMRVPFRERWRVVRGHAAQVVVLGAVMSLFLIIPFGGIVMAPLMYVLGVDRVARWGVRAVPNGHGSLRPSP